MKRISFAMTTKQVLDRTKTVTRRMGWRNLQPGERLLAVDKLRTKDAKKLGVIEVVNARRERVLDVNADDVRREGMARGECWCKRTPCLANVGVGVDWCFINTFCDAMHVAPDAEVTRIEFRYVDEVIQ